MNKDQFKKWLFDNFRLNEESVMDFEDCWEAYNQGRLDERNSRRISVIGISEKQFPKK